MKKLRTLFWSEVSRFVYGYRHEFEDEEDFIQEVKLQNDEECKVKNVKVEPCILSGNEIYADTITPLKLADFSIKNFYTAEVEIIK